MRTPSRVTMLVVVALVAGCAKPLAPVSDSARTAASSGDRAVPNARDRAFDVQLKFTGTIVTLEPGLVPRVHEREVFYITGPTPDGAVPDTVPAYSRLEKIQWRRSTIALAQEGEGSAPSEDPALDPSASDDQVFAPGNYALVLQAPDRAGGGEVTVRFFAGFLPDVWWAGPDPSLWPPSSDGDGRAVDVTDWSSFATTPAWPPDGRSYFGPDSFRFIPSVRRPVGDDLERRTFYEIYGDRIYARAEGDAVHLGAWIVVVNGGYDKDSPYSPRVVAGDPGLPPDFAANPSLYPVLHDLGLVGSPIGFRTQLTTKLPDGTIFRAPSTGLYPVFDPGSVFRLPQLAGYWRAQLPGQAYIVARAEDADGLVPGLLTDPVGIVERVDAGGGTPEERLARRRILTFQVREAGARAPAGAPTSAGVVRAR